MSRISCTVRLCTSKLGRLATGIKDSQPDGAKVKRGVTIASTHVYDIVPPIRSYMGLPLPGDLDGKIMEEAFEQAPSTDAHSEENSLVQRKLKKLASQPT